jgi:hypothetical protein
VAQALESSAVPGAALHLVLAVQEMQAATTRRVVQQAPEREAESRQVIHLVLAVLVGLSMALQRVERALAVPSIRRVEMGLLPQRTVASPDLVVVVVGRLPAQAERAATAASMALAVAEAAHRSMATTLARAVTVQMASSL